MVNNNGSEKSDSFTVMVMKINCNFFLKKKNPSEEVHTQSLERKKEFFLNLKINLDRQTLFLKAINFLFKLLLPNNDGGANKQKK